MRSKSEWAEPKTNGQATKRCQSSCKVSRYSLAK